MTAPRLSVIIPTRNRGAFLEKTLLGLTEQDSEPSLFETIVVDNGSTDNTREIAAHYRNRLSRLIYLYDETPGLHVGRHLGLKHAQTGLLVYGDDDIEPFPGWIRSIYESFRDPEVVMVGGKCLPEFETEPPDWVHEMWAPNRHGVRYTGFLSILDFGDEIREISPTGIIGCNFSIRKHTLLEVGGFHPDSVPEHMMRFRGDGESWVNQSVRDRGLTALYHPAASVRHFVPTKRMTLEYLYQRAYREGISLSFREIRKLGRPDGAPEHLLRAWNLCKQRLKWGLGREAWPNAAERLLLKGKRAGYHFHQRETKRDPELLAWVLKENYF